jgi:hypothetical protein
MMDKKYPRVPYRGRVVPFTPYTGTLRVSRVGLLVRIHVRTTTNAISLYVHTYIIYTRGDGCAI